MAPPLAAPARAPAARRPGDEGRNLRSPDVERDAARDDGCAGRQRCGLLTARVERVAAGERWTHPGSPVLPDGEHPPARIQQRPAGEQCARFHLGTGHDRRTVHRQARHQQRTDLLGTRNRRTRDRQTHHEQAHLGQTGDQRTGHE
ncbi:hypothetical protein ACFQ0G_41060 [Streptomyces chiangmaiensis]